jgi:murein DD-endopeptidase MepM/ murein hydrolase activator NlpD
MKQRIPLETGIVIMFCVLALDILHAQTFRWPVNQGQSITISQDYSEYNGVPLIAPNKYHTGIDLYTSDLVIRATADGIVESVRVAGQNDGGWGNAIILRHANGTYSLYAHMASPPQFTIGQNCTAGTQLGIMGNTGNVSNVHLHFEIKHNSNFGPGYLYDLPDGYNYEDPRISILPFTESNITPVVVKVISANNVDVRSGPNGGAPRCVNCFAPLTQLQPNQKFVAYKQNADWYRIYLPNYYGNVSGWVIRTSSLVEDLTVGQVQVRSTATGGLFVRPEPGSSLHVKTRNNQLPLKIWPGQRFAVLETSIVGNYTWYKIDLPTLAIQSYGWARGDYLDYYEPQGNLQYAYSLAQGLNLISFPFTPSPSRFSDLFASLGSDLFQYVFYLNDQGVLEYSTTQNSYAVAKKGYFLFLNNARSITVSGYASNRGVVLRKGLNIIGVTEQVTPPSNSNVYPYAFYIQNGSVSSTQIFQNGLQPGIGYFVFSQTDNNVLISDNTAAPLAANGTPPDEMSRGSLSKDTPHNPSMLLDADFTAQVVAQQQGAPSPVTLKFGIKPIATDNYDDGLDQIRSIPVPGQLIAFYNENYGLAENYKAYALTKEWPVTVSSQSSTQGQPDNFNPVQLSWTIPLSGSLPPNTTFELRDNYNNLLVANMLTTTSYSFSVGGPSTTKNFIIRATFESTPPPSAPIVTTASATEITQTSARLNGTINPNGSGTTYYFQYGPTTSYGFTTPVQTGLSGSNTIPVSYTVYDLNPNTTYHYRLVASNIGGTSQGSDNNRLHTIKPHLQR